MHTHIHILPEDRGISQDRSKQTWNRPARLIHGEAAFMQRHNYWGTLRNLLGLDLANANTQNVHRLRRTRAHPSGNSALHHFSPCLRCRLLMLFEQPDTCRSKLRVQERNLPTLLKSCKLILSFSFNWFYKVAKKRREYIVEGKSKTLKSK